MNLLLGKLHPNRPGDTPQGPISPDMPEEPTLPLDNVVIENNYLKINYSESFLSRISINLGWIPIDSTDAVKSYTEGMYEMGATVYLEYFDALVDIGLSTFENQAMSNATGYTALEEGMEIKHAVYEGRHCYGWTKAGNYVLVKCDEEIAIEEIASIAQAISFN